jgi:hypothetical protein
MIIKTTCKAHHMLKSTISFVSNRMPLSMAVASAGADVLADRR